MSYEPINAETRRLQREAVADPTNVALAVRFVAALAREQNTPAVLKKQRGGPSMSLGPEMDVRLTKEWKWNGVPIHAVIGFAVRGLGRVVVDATCDIVQDEVLISIRRLGPDSTITDDRPVQPAGIPSQSPLGSCDCGHDRQDHRGAFQGTMPGPECSRCSCTEFNPIRIPTRLSPCRCGHLHRDVATPITCGACGCSGERAQRCTCGRMAWEHDAPTQCRRFVPVGQPRVDDCTTCGHEPHPSEGEVRRPADFCGRPTLGGAPCGCRRYVARGSGPQRECERDDCVNVLPPSHTAVYCTNECARRDA